MIGVEQEFFETQPILSMQCGMHSINNLLLRPAYMKAQMEQICYQLSDETINPHKHILGGDYDANVIILALQQQGFEVQWMDRRKPFQVPVDQNRPTLGFLLNLQIPKRIYHRIMKFSARHWVSIRVKEGTYYLCDSNQKQKSEIGDKKAFVAYVQQNLNKGAEVFWVYKNNDG